MEGKDKKDGVQSDTRYAHNPRYCMILPDAEDEFEEDIRSILKEKSRAQFAFGFFNNSVCGSKVLLRKLVFENVMVKEWVAVHGIVFVRIFLFPVRP